ncbi:phasin family protein [Paraburkholderia phytofirmans]|uniref:phasin family protein n=1 Tax=Paraburkholderia phytofirmans TaxID=261302 RepID=UPI0038BD19A7
MNNGILKYQPLRAGKSGNADVYDWMARAVPGLERVARLISRAGKPPLDEQPQVLAAMALCSRSVYEALFLQTEQLHAALNGMVACWRHIGEIAAKSGNDYASLAQVNLQGVMAAVSELVGVQPADWERAATSASAQITWPGLASGRKVVIPPGSSAFLAGRVPRGRLH